MKEKMHELDISTDEDIVAVQLGNGVELGEVIEDIFSVREYFSALLEDDPKQYTRDIIRKMVAVTLIMREHRFQSLPHEDYYLFADEVRRLTDDFTQLNRDLVANEIKTYVDEEFRPVDDIKQYHAMIDDIMEFLKP